MVLGIKKQILRIAYWPCMTETLLDPAVSPALTVEEPSGTTALSLLPECLPFTAVLLKYFLLPSRPAGLYSNFRSSAGILLSYETFPDPREVASSVTKITMCPGLSGKFRFSPVFWLLAPLIHWFQASGPPTYNSFYILYLSFIRITQLLKIHMILFFSTCFLRETVRNILTIICLVCSITEFPTYGRIMGTSKMLIEWMRDWLKKWGIEILSNCFHQGQKGDRSCFNLHFFDNYKEIFFLTIYIPLWIFDSYPELFHFLWSLLYYYVCEQFIYYRH